MKAALSFLRLLAMRIRQSRPRITLIRFGVISGTSRVK
jgi:hypothetical protein